MAISSFNNGRQNTTLVGKDSLAQDRKIQSVVRNDGITAMPIDGSVTVTSSSPPNTAVYSELTVGTSAVELKVGASALANRNYITMFAKDTAVYWGYDSSVTTITGTRIFKSQLIFLDVGSSVTVYLIADGAGKKVSIGEVGV